MYPNSAAGIQIRCYVCTKTATVPGIIVGEVDLLAGAKTKVDQMIDRAKAQARKVARRKDVHRTGTADR